MAHELMICPHCRIRREMSSTDYWYLSDVVGHFYFVCPSCDMPITVMAGVKNPKSGCMKPNDVKVSSRSFAKCGWAVLETWPQPRLQRTESLRGVPEAIEALFEQSVEVAQKGGYDLAIMGFQRALKLAQRRLTPEFKGNSFRWIIALIDLGELSGNLREWATRLKIHRGIQEATALQAEEFATFVHVVLEQLFAITSRMASYRAGGTADRPGPIHLQVRDV